MTVSTITHAEIHQWREADGNLHFGDKPPANMESAIVEIKPNVYASPSVEKLEAILATPDEVVMYSAVWCGYCKKARKYFQQSGIPFKEYDVETNAKGKRDYKKLQARGVPVILVGDKRLNGFSEASFKRIYAQ